MGGKKSKPALGASGRVSVRPSTKDPNYEYEYAYDEEEEPSGKEKRKSGGGGKKQKKKQKKRRRKGTSSGAARKSGTEKTKVEKQVKAIEEEGIGEGEVVYNDSSTEKVSREDFELLTMIGKGSFGKVMQVKYKKTGQIFAMKVLNKDAIIARKQVVHTKAEKSILQKVQHPFIVKLHFAFQTPDKLYMILDYINGGELFFHLKKEGRFPEERVKQYAAEISSALMHLHAIDIVYRDLKPENILIDRTGHIVITDFGLSKEIDQSQGTHTFCGTPEYLAPEILKGQAHSLGVDWWSLGTLLYEMLTGLPPFFSQNVNLMYQKILQSELKFPAHVSGDAKDLLQGFLTRDPDERLGSPKKGGEDQIKKHPWFKEIDWDKLYRREIVPSWIPPVTSDSDTGQIDTAFTQEAPSDSPEKESPMKNAASTNFDGFTFQAPSALGGK